MIIEDYSGCNLFQFIKRKSDASNKIIDVIRKLERQAGVKVKILQCNGASEFIGQETSLGIYCHKKGIEIHHSSPCCPQENDVAERGNYTRWNTTQVIHLAAGLPANFWKFAKRMAVKLISMTVKEGEKITPLEKLYERKPSMDLIRTFGCHTFTHIL